MLFGCFGSELWRRGGIFLDLTRPPHQNRLKQHSGRHRAHSNARANAAVTASPIIELKNTAATIRHERSASHSMMTAPSRAVSVSRMRFVE
jgi:hypothetical protein